jgi:2-dehydro-3-deoxygalactonokinase
LVSKAARRNEGANRVGLLHLLFSARAAVVSGRMDPKLLGPYLSGLLTGDEIAGALAQFPGASSVTIVADSPRADLYVDALGRRGIGTNVRAPQQALIVGWPESCGTDPFRSSLAFGAEAAHPGARAESKRPGVSTGPLLVLSL